MKYLITSFMAIMLVGFAHPGLSNNGGKTPPASKKAPVKKSQAPKPASRAKPKADIIKPIEIALPQKPVVKPLTLIDDGISIQEPGVFSPGCYYGENESQSDHAPVIYNDFATWNVAGPISHFMIQPDPQKPSIKFFNHKFFTDDQGNLISPTGGRVGFLGGSEVALFSRSVKSPEVIREELIKALKLADQDQIIKNRRQLIGKVKEILGDLLQEVKAGTEDANQEDKIKVLNQLGEQAIRELNQDDEKIYHATIQLYDAYDRGYSLPTEHYIKRMERVSQKIKDMFKDNSNLTYMVLQEVPKNSDETVAGENIQSLIKEMFKPEDLWVKAIKKVLDDATVDDKGIRHINTDKLESVLGDAIDRVPDGDITAFAEKLANLKKKHLALKEAGDAQALNIEMQIDGLIKLKDQAENLNIDFYQKGKGIRLKTKTGENPKFKKGNFADVALVSRPNAPELTQVAVDLDNRFNAWCSETINSCFVAVHMFYPDPDVELKTRCLDLKNMAVTLYKKGFQNISFAGDFNTYASRIARVCQAILPAPNAVVELHTSQGEKGNSCGSNDGHVGAHNIDIMIKYSFALPPPPKKPFLPSTQMIKASEPKTLMEKIASEPDVKIPRHHHRLQ